jgi:hypothetical protein
MVMMMKNFTFSILFSIIGIILFGCKEQPPEPKKNDIIPGKREYIWTVDTLLYHPFGQTLLRSLWGSSTTNVYAAGHDAHSGHATLWHFNGIKWSIVGLLPAYGGQIEGPYTLQSIYGFDSTNIYAVGSRIFQTFSNKPPYFIDSSFIIHFDGNDWREVNINRVNFVLNNVVGISPIKIWCTSIGNVLYYYNGITWEIDTIPNVRHDSADVIIYNTITESIDGTVIFSTTVYNDKTGGFKYYLTKKEQQEWIQIDSFKSIDAPKWGASKFWADDKGTIYSSGQEIYKYSSNQWISIYRPQFTGINIWSNSSNNIFVTSLFGDLHHFNGIDWAKILIPTNNNMILEGIWGMNDEIFISAIDGTRTFIFHGK